MRAMRAPRARRSCSRRDTGRTQTRICRSWPTFVRELKRLDDVDGRMRVMTHRFVRTMSIVAGAVVILCTASSAVPQEAGKVDVTGKWAFTVETSAGSGTPKFTFKQAGEKLTGHYSG